MLKNKQFTIRWCAFMKIVLMAMIVASFYFLLKGALKYDLKGTMIAKPKHNDSTENSLSSIYYSSYKYLS